jgi:uncharacterized membrane protein YgdD (TMEM256/DUF423 family)
MNAKACLIVGTLLAGLAVAAGTFGAHLLPQLLEQRHGLTAESSPVDFARAEKNFETGARYQMFHALGLILIGLLLERRPTTALKVAAASFLFGSLVFSGCLYALVILQERWLGMIVPLGGLAFLFGWSAMLIGVASRLPDTTES